MIQVQMVKFESNQLFAKFTEINLHVTLVYHFFLQSQPESDLTVLIMLMCEMTWAFAFVFVICEFGQKVSNAFIEIEHETGQLEWYLFTMDIQRILLILMIVAQNPVGLHVFGDISCDREDFKKVSDKTQSELCLRHLVCGTFGCCCLF